MNDDRWLRELAQVNREKEAEERDRLDERWDRLSAGELSREEAAELRALAETSEEAREVYEAFRPLGAEFQARMVSALSAELADQAPAESEEPRSWLLPFRPAITRFGGWATAAAAAAAVLVLLLRPAAPLPDYVLAKVSGGTSTWRGEEPEAANVAVLAPGDGFQVVLRPDTEVTRAKSLEARALLLRGRELRNLETQSHIEPNGVVKLEGSLDGDLPPGTWTLWAVVGRRGELPDPEELRSFSARSPVRQRDWVAVPQNVRIRPRAP